MSDPIEQLVAMMQEMSAAIRTLTANEEKLLAEQAHAAQALAETGRILANHAEILRSVQGAVVTLWEQAGLPMADVLPELPPAVN